jgi:hypothetical protein
MGWHSQFGPRSPRKLKEVLAPAAEIKTIRIPTIESCIVMDIGKMVHRKRNGFTPLSQLNTIVPSVPSISFSGALEGMAKRTQKRGKKKRVCTGVYSSGRYSHFFQGQVER